MARRDEKAHFLVTAAGEPFEIERGQTFVLGRSTQADLVARSTDVSRKHAQIVFDLAGQVRVAHLEGRHGTFVNGEQLKPNQPVVLQHGDHVRLASNTVFYYLHLPHTALLAEIQARGVGELTAAHALADIEKKKATRRASRGKRKTAPPMMPTKGTVNSGTQIVSMLKSTKATGLLTFFDGVTKGELTFKEGRFRSGTAGRDLEGDPALVHFEKLRQGTYRFREMSFETKAPEQGLFSKTPASDVLIQLHDARASGILNLGREDAPEKLTGRAVFVDGICRSAGFGKLVSRAALDKIGELGIGSFRFEPKTPDELDGTLLTPRSQREAIGEEPSRKAPPPLPSRPEAPPKPRRPKAPPRPRRRG